MEEYKKKEVLEQLISEGLTIPQMAIKLSCGTTTIKSWLKKYGLKTINAQSYNKLIKTTCGFCEINIVKQPYELRRSKTGKLFCSRSCANAFANTKVSKKQFLNKTLKEYRECHKNKKPPNASLYGALRDLARSWHQKLTIIPCANCGYSHHVELCHIRAISDFNDDETIGDVNCEENIIQLCRNCHWELDNGYLSIDDIKS